MELEHWLTQHGVELRAVYPSVESNFDSKSKHLLLLLSNIFKKLGGTARRNLFREYLREN